MEKLFELLAWHINWLRNQAGRDDSDELEMTIVEAKRDWSEMERRVKRLEARPAYRHEGPCD